MSKHYVPSCERTSQNQLRINIVLSSRNEVASWKCLKATRVISELALPRHAPITLITRSQPEPARVEVESCGDDSACRPW